MAPRRDDRPPLTLGTAGHIDHGKTALVDVLTGKNTDRLPEERSRGISIELGYAPLVLPSGRQLSVVDVPGHERFVRTMVAGASGVDMFLLCVAADDGVMPQTREHLAVLRHLGVGAGVVAITKADIGEPELAAQEAAELLPGVPVVTVSATKRTGLDELRAALDDVAAGLPGRAGDGGPARLHVDRSFTLRGIGTVVTGTLWSGRIGAGDQVRVLPRGLEARVRSVQVHDQPVERAEAGQRVALNLVGVGWRELGRGDVVTEPGAPFAAGYLLDAAVQLEPGARPLRRGERVHVHHGTREAPARVVPLEGEQIAPGVRAYAQLRLEVPLVASAGDRLIVRQLAPPDTVGGGVVVDAAPRKHGPGAEAVERLRALERGEPVDAPQAAEEPDREPPAEPAPSPLDDASLHVAALLRSDGGAPRAHADLAVAAGLDLGETEARLVLLERAGQAVRVGRNLHFHAEPLAELEARVVAICQRDGQTTIAALRDELGSSRKLAQAVLEHLDRTRVTRRDGDVHVLRRGAAG
ncbi:MAG: selenocysteine-specific elongation factor [Thermoleophilaceae bacterium]|jgi:selenocysteine-specific elongation factor|nr:selenocysteine-specific elongation factor [Thermoleophilaceae bacterium]